MVVIEIRNAELMETVTKEAKRLDITNGAIVSLIGAVDSFTISTMPKHNATQDIITDYPLPAEMTGTGKITNGKVHIHAVMAIEGGPSSRRSPVPRRNRHLLRPRLRHLLLSVTCLEGRTLR